MIAYELNKKKWKFRAGMKWLSVGNASSLQKFRFFCCKVITVITMGVPLSSSEVPSTYC